MLSGGSTANKIHSWLASPKRPEQTARFILKSQKDGPSVSLPFSQAPAAFERLCSNSGVHSDVIDFVSQRLSSFTPGQNATKLDLPALVAYLKLGAEIILLNLKGAVNADELKGQGLHCVIPNQANKPAQAKIVHRRRPSDSNPRLVVISSGLNDLETISAAVLPDNGLLVYDFEASIHVLLSQLKQLTTGIPALDSISFLFHGAPGKMWVTKETEVNQESLRQKEQRSFFEAVGQLVNEKGRIDFLACNLLAEGAGNQFLQLLEQACQRNCAGSSNLTGARSSGGDFILESDGVDAESLYFNPVLSQTWTGLLWGQDVKYIDVSDVDFEEQLRGPLPSLWYFWTSWCGPCRMVAPVIYKTAHQFAGEITVFRVNVDDSPTIAVHWGIRSVPTLVLYKPGEGIVSAVAGVTHEWQLTKRIREELL